MGLILKIACDCSTVQVMEDLYDSGYESGPIAAAVSEERFKAMLANAAKLHAWGWGKRDELPIPNLWYDSPTEAGNQGRMPRQAAAKAKFGSGKNVAKFQEIWADYETLQLGGGRANLFKEHPEYRPMMDALVAGTAVWEPRAAAMWPAADQPKPVGSTILHGDAHQWNHMFRKASADGDKPADPTDASSHKQSDRLLVVT